MSKATEVQITDDGCRVVFEDGSEIFPASQGEATAAIYNGARLTKKVEAIASSCCARARHLRQLTKDFYRGGNRIDGDIMRITRHLHQCKDSKPLEDPFKGF